MEPTLFKVFEGALLGNNVFLGSHVVVHSGAQIEDGCIIEGLSQIWAGVHLARNVRLGPGVCFEYPTQHVAKTNASIYIGADSQIGANAVICNGISIGSGACVLPGTVINQDVPPYSIVGGSPARVTGYVGNGVLESVDISPQVGTTFQSEQNVVKVGVGDVSLHRCKLVGDMRGDLSVGEFSREVPFDPKRYFLVFNVPSEKVRGEHAHRKCHQFLICVRGSCSVVVDDGASRCEIKLDSPDKGIYLPPMTWGIQYKYTADALLLVFASEYYDASDYIRDYQEFVSLSRPANELPT